jgi:hypothetical protein
LLATLCCRKLPIGTNMTKVNWRFVRMCYLYLHWRGINRARGIISLRNAGKSILDYKASHSRKLHSSQVGRMKTLRPANMDMKQEAKFASRQSMNVLQRLSRPLIASLLRYMP